MVIQKAVVKSTTNVGEQCASEASKLTLTITSDPPAIGDREWLHTCFLSKYSYLTYHGNEEQCFKTKDGS